jgi:bifunctional DNA-binding transcriptional regulator/antitoxin component of YhaV-PrlF toxin-antitoxin module
LNIAVQLNKLRYIRRCNRGCSTVKTTIHKIDDSEGVIIPRELLDRMNLRVGDQPQIVETNDGIALRPLADSFDGPRGHGQI